MGNKSFDNCGVQNGVVVWAKEEERSCGGCFLSPESGIWIETTSQRKKEEIRLGLFMLDVGGGPHLNGGKQKRAFWLKNI